MPEPDVYQANLQRGILLRQSNRAREAVPFLQEAISIRPDEPQAYAELALCWIEIPKEGGKAVSAIDRAIGLDPNVSYYFGLKGWILVRLYRGPAALLAAAEGIKLNPNCIRSLNAQANAYTKLSRWREVEGTCRRILELEPDDSPALNLLAQALRQLGRWKESRATVGQLLALLPNDAFGQVNAGYGALSVGDHLRANEHFLQALRMEPHDELARRGLLSSLRARVWLVRLNNRLFSGLQYQPTGWEALKLFLRVGAFFLALMVIMVAGNFIYPDLGTHALMIIMAVMLFSAFPIGLCFGCAAIMAVLGNFLLLFDPLGRHAFTTTEKVFACLPAALFCLVFVFLFVSGMWKVAAGLILLTAIFTLSIEYPLLKDRWQRRREEGLRE